MSTTLKRVSVVTLICRRCGWLAPCALTAAAAAIRHATMMTAAAAVTRRIAVEVMTTPLARRLSPSDAYERVACPAVVGRPSHPRRTAGHAGRQGWRAGVCHGGAHHEPLMSWWRPPRQSAGGGTVRGAA